MNHGPLIFLGLLATFVASWWGLVFAPQTQIGSQPQSQTDSGAYPNRRPGFAQQGREVYVAAGCVQCHSQQVQQEGFTFNVTLTAAGTNTEKVTAILGKAGVDAKPAVLAAATDTSPQTLLKNVPQTAADDLQRKLKKAGATAQTVFIPLGVDMQRNWGARRTVGADYLYDLPVQVGNSRLGPDLSNAGVDIVTIGQYLRPSGTQLPVARFYTPDEFAALKREGESLGIRHVESGPLVRSSYHAHEQTEAYRERATA